MFSPKPSRIVILEEGIKRRGNRICGYFDEVMQMAINSMQGPNLIFVSEALPVRIAAESPKYRASAPKHAINLFYEYFPVNP